MDNSSYVKRLVKICLIVGTGLQLYNACAVRKAPPGGPPDKTPPQVVRTFPSADSTNVRQLEHLEIEFDEAIDQTSVQKQIWLLPELPNGFEIEWKGSDKLRIVPNDSLETNQTYLLTIGTGVSDIRRNNLDQPIVLPFSTGPIIDQGKISGRVVAERTKGVFIYAYQISDTFSAQTVFKGKPRYYTQVGKDGRYQIRYLKSAPYRLYALDDQTGDRLYTLEADQIGIPFMDLELDSTKQQYDYINFTLIREDTTGPKLLRTQSVNNQKIEIVFDEGLIDSQQFDIQIIDSLQEEPLQIYGEEPDISDPAKLLVYTAVQEKVLYKGTINPVRDEAGNLSDSVPSKFKFTGKPEPDTTTVRLIEIIPRQQQKNVAYDSDVQLTFSYPVDTVTLRENFQLIDQDSIGVAGNWRFRSLSAPRFVPDTLLKKGQTYTLALNLVNVRNVFGQAFGDSTYIHQFTTWDWSQLGEISGEVTVSKKDWKRAIIEVTTLSGRKVASVAAEVGKSYQISFLPDGQYFLQAKMDVNQNGRYDKGQSLPFQFAEPFIEYQDTVKVRKRWTTEGINFHFSP
ncbi:MAG: hypothetical protein GWN16_15265 [Calditrichae bacterium]|nr:hypothetical protein [Calditrichia bacterium]